MTVEKDPYGKTPNQPGAKLDAGKIRVALMEAGFPRALMAVAEVTTFGARKYTDHGWLSVPDAFQRYSEAAGRHRLKRYMGEERADDSGLLHLAHEAWNVLAMLELELRRTDAMIKMTTEQGSLIERDEQYKRGTTERRVCCQCKKEIQEDDIGAMFWRIASEKFNNVHLVCGECGKKEQFGT